MNYTDEQIRLLMTGYPDGQAPPTRKKPRNKDRNRTLRKMQRRSRKKNR